MRTETRSAAENGSDAVLRSYVDRIETDHAALEEWRGRCGRTVYRRIVAACLVTLACHAVMFDRIDPERALWQICLMIMAHCALTTLAGIINLVSGRILLAFIIGLGTANVTEFLFAVQDRLFIALSPMSIAWVLLPLLFRIPKRPVPSPF